MKKSKTASKQREEESELAPRRFKVLGDKNRLAILKLLMKDRLPVGEIAGSLGIERTLVSHNLKVLRDEGLVTAERQGKEMVYSVADAIVLEKPETLDLECCQIRFK
jgi:DNA-binding transcriptional ArsR family regulator